MKKNLILILVLLVMGLNVTEASPITQEAFPVGIQNPYVKVSEVVPDTVKPSKKTDSLAYIYWVHDGDTYHAWLFLDSVRSTPKHQYLDFRLALVDCPEVFSPPFVTKDQPFGYAVADTVRQILRGKFVRFNIVGQDVFGNSLVDIILDGKHLYEIILENGWGWYQSKGSRDFPLAVRKKCIALQKQAESGKRGIFGDNNPATLDHDPPMPPWEWKKKHRKFKVKRINDRRTGTK